MDEANIAHDIDDGKDSTENWAQGVYQTSPRPIRSGDVLNMRLLDTMSMLHLCEATLAKHHHMVGGLCKSRKDTWKA